MRTQEQQIMQQLQYLATSFKLREQVAHNLQLSRERSACPSKVADL